MYRLTHACTYLAILGVVFFYNFIATVVQSNKARKNADGREAMITYGEDESENVCFSTGNSLRTTNTTINNQEKITSKDLEQFLNVNIMHHPHRSTTFFINRFGNKEKDTILGKELLAPQMSMRLRMKRMQVSIYCSKHC